MEELESQKNETTREKGKIYHSLAEGLGLGKKEEKEKRKRKRIWHPIGAEGLEVLEARRQPFMCFQKYQHHPLRAKGLGFRV